MGPVHVGGRGFGGSVKFADGKTSSANVPHLNAWGFDISAAEFPQQKKRASLVWIGPESLFNIAFYNRNPRWNECLSKFPCPLCLRSAVVFTGYPTLSSEFRSKLSAIGPGRSADRVGLYTSCVIDLMIGVRHISSQLSSIIIQLQWYVQRICCHHPFKFIIIISSLRS